MLLYIIRHGDPIYSPDSLTEKGIRQAEALSARLAQSGINRIFSSSNRRAQMTAAPTCRVLGLDCMIEDWMSEDHAWRDFSIERENGEHTWAFNVQTTVVKTDPVYTTDKPWYEADYLKRIDAKAGYQRVANHSDDFLTHLGYERQGEIYKIRQAHDDRVAVFCHQGFGSIWLSHLLAIPPHFIWPNFDLTHSSVTILEFVNYEDGYTAPRCLCLSDLSHLFAAGIPLHYNNRVYL